MTTRRRRKDIEAIDAVLKSIATYNAGDLLLAGLLDDKEEMEREKEVKSYLEARKTAIGKIRMHKQSDVEMRFCAQTLRDFFRSVTRNPMDEYVGSLLVHAFRWPRGFGGDLRLAALQRAKGPSIIARRLTLEEALQLQTPDPDRQRFEMEKQNLLIASCRGTAKEADAWERKFGAIERRYKELWAKREDLTTKEQRDLQRLAITLQGAQSDRRNRPDEALTKYFELVDQQKFLAAEAKSATPS
jgi:hypothetical protein